MKKKLFAIIGVGILSLSMVGCGSTSIKSTSTTSNYEEDDTTRNDYDNDDDDEDETTRSNRDDDEDDDEDDTTKSHTATKVPHVSLHNNSETTRPYSSDDDEDETYGYDEDDDEDDVDTSDWETYREDGYSFMLPDYFEKEGVYFFDATSLDDNFGDNFNAMIQDLTGYNMDLDGYLQLSLKQYEETDYEVVSTEECAVDGHDGYLVLVGTEMENNGEDLLLYCCQYFSVYDNKAYLFSFTATDDYFIDNIDMISAIFDSIHLY